MIKGNPIRNFIFFLLALGFMFGIVIWMASALISYMFFDDTITSDKPIEPEIELIIKGNDIDTLYIYREP